MTVIALIFGGCYGVSAIGLSTGGVLVAKSKGDGGVVQFYMLWEVAGAE